VWFEGGRQPPTPHPLYIGRTDLRIHAESQFNGQVNGYEVALLPRYPATRSLTVALLPRNLPLRLENRNGLIVYFFTVSVGGLASQNLLSHDRLHNFRLLRRRWFLQNQFR
jgi:hypothetical protein